MARPMGQLVECCVVEVVRALEPGECRHRDKISARNIERFTVSFSDVRAGRAQEVVGKLVARVEIANSHLFTSGDAIRKVLALVDG